MLSATAPPSGFMTMTVRNTKNRQNSPRRPHSSSMSNKSKNNNYTTATTKKKTSPRERRLSSFSNRRRIRRQSVKQLRHETGIDPDRTSSKRDPEDIRSDLPQSASNEDTEEGGLDKNTKKSRNNREPQLRDLKNRERNSNQHPLAKHFTEHSRDMLSQVRLRMQSRRDGVVQWEPRRLGINYAHIVHKYRLRREEIRDETREKKESSKKIKRGFDQHRWLIGHGHKARQQKKQAHLKRLRQWWDFLDADGGGTLSVDELEDPLVSVGLARGRADVEKLIEMHDTSGEGELSFENFTSMLTARNSGYSPEINVPVKKKISNNNDKDNSANSASKKNKEESTGNNDKNMERTKNKNKNEKNAVMQLFDDLEDGKFGNKIVSLPLQISTFRRQMLLNVHLSPNPIDRAKGLMVLNGIIDTKRSQRKDLETAAAETELF